MRRSLTNIELDEFRILHGSYVTSLHKMAVDAQGNIITKMHVEYITLPDLCPYLCILSAGRGLECWMLPDMEEANQEPGVLPVSVSGLRRRCQASRIV